MPAAKRKRSKAMCVALPMPASAHTILPGLSFAAPTNSLMVLYFSGWVTSTVGIVATAATGCSSSGFITFGLRSGETVNAEAYIMIRCPSGAESATYFAPTRPPAPRRFSTITGWPHFAVSLSARMRAIVSEALPGVTPETKRTVLVGKVCAQARPEKRSADRKIENRFICILLLCFRQSELRRQPVRSLAAVSVRTVVGIVPAVLDYHELDRPGDALGEPLRMRRLHQAVLAAGHDQDRTGDPRRRLHHRKLFRLGLGRGFVLRV